MELRNRRIIYTLLGCCLTAAAHAQGLTLLKDSQGEPALTLSGSVESNILLPREDKDINAYDGPEDALTNTYVELHLGSKYVEAGARLEYLQYPLPGYEPGLKGWGVPHLYIKGHYRWAELTVGDMYEQFGSGFILRTYEERSLGIDNALRGGRLVLTPTDGLTVKALAGRQRHYWDWNAAIVSGADIELQLGQWIKPMQHSGTRLTLGASWVNKHEDDTHDIMPEGDVNHLLRMPEYVNAFDVRAQLQTRGGLNVLAEYARKTQDPSRDNGYIYRPGQVAMLSVSYSKKGMSALVQAKRSDNMSSRSDRKVSGTSSMLNHLPAFTLDHTYTLAALYPYATNQTGEWAYQAELGYRFAKNTSLGGKYGTHLKLNFSHVRSIDRQPTDEPQGGYTSSFFRQGDTRFYQDLNVQMEKRLSRSTTLNLMYMNQVYNKTAVEGEGGTIKSNIFVGEGKFRLSRKATLRAEAQYLQTKDDEGDWAYALLELSLPPHWMLTVSDLWNVGNSDSELYAENTHHHYYQAGLTFTGGAHRVQAAYGRTRAGYNCSGGVCRWVPATSGLTVAYTYNF